MSTPEIRVFELTEYSDEIAAGIGLLMHQLDPVLFSGEPAPRHGLERMIRSDFHAQFVAEHPTAGIVGALSVSTLLESGLLEQGYVGGVATREDMRGRGIGRQLVDCMFDWARRRNMGELELVTERSKPTQPLDFWLHMGAEIKDDSAVLTIKVPQ